MPLTHPRPAPCHTAIVSSITPLGRSLVPVVRARDRQLGAAAALAISLALFAYARSLGGDRGSVLPVVLDIAIILSVSLTPFWPTAGAIGMGLALSVSTIIPGFAPSATVLCLFIPIFVACVAGLDRLRNIITAWYLIAMLMAPSARPLTLAETVQSAFILAMMTAITWLVGITIGRLNLRVDALETARIQAIAAERRLIAQDLHDSVSSATTRIIMRAEQAKLRGIGDPQLASDVDYILTTGRQSTSDLRALLTTLRTEVGGETASGWHIASLADTVEHSADELRRSGFTVDAKVTLDDESLAPSTRDALGKVLKEAIANVVKHAEPRSTCTLLVDQDDDGVELVVANRTKTAGRAGRGTGLGLIGARERVETLGGEFETTRGAAGWVLRARIPVPRTDI